MHPIHLARDAPFVLEAPRFLLLVRGSGGELHSHGPAVEEALSPSMPASLLCSTLFRGAMVALGEIPGVIIGQLCVLAHS